MQQTDQTPPERSDERDAPAPFSDLIQMALRIVPLVAVFSAVSYSLGRLYTESYYRWYGIPDSALQFSNADYLFASFEMTVVGGLYALGLWISITLLRESIENAGEKNGVTQTNPTAENANQGGFIQSIVYASGNAWSVIRRWRELVISVVVMGAFPTFYIWRLTSEPSWEAFPGLWGLFTGSYLAYYGIMLSFLLNRWWLRRPVISPTLLLSILVAPMLLAAIVLFPFMSQKLAANDARADLNHRLQVSNLQIYETSLLELGTDKGGPAGIETELSDVELKVVVVYSNSDAVYFALESDVRERQRESAEMRVDRREIGLRTKSTEIASVAEIEAELAALDAREKRFNDDLLRIHVIPLTRVAALVHHISGYEPYEKPRRYQPKSLL